MRFFGILLLVLSSQPGFGAQVTSHLSPYKQWKACEVKFPNLVKAVDPQYDASDANKNSSPPFYVVQALDNMNPSDIANFQDCLQAGQRVATIKNQTETKARLKKIDEALKNARFHPNNEENGLGAPGSKLPEWTTTDTFNIYIQNGRLTFSAQRQTVSPVQPDPNAPFLGGELGGGTLPGPADRGQGPSEAAPAQPEGSQTPPIQMDSI